MQLSSQRFEQACAFVNSHARDLDKRLLAYYFKGGTAASVLDELARYQNSDGGFGHAMEPDFRLESSTPMATSVGLQYAADVHAPANHPVIVRAMQYLAATYADGFWPSLTEAVNQVPRAPWWQYRGADAPAEDDWPNVSAELFGYLWAYAETVPADLLERVSLRARQNLDSGPTLEGFFRYNILCWQRALPHLPETLRLDAEAKIRATFSKYPYTDENYGEVNICWLAPSPDSILAQMEPDAVAVGIDRVIQTQTADGGWWPGWTWGQYEDVWDTAKVEWAGKITTETLHVLNNFGRIG
jgi:hypothetical protein